MTLRYFLIPLRVPCWLVFAALLLAGLALNVVAGLVLWPAAKLVRPVAAAHFALRDRSLRHA
jgi:hypothetical protein